MINFCHIVPVAYLPFVRHYPVHLLLAHLVEENEEYRNFYINLKRENPSVFYHLDNSAFEMFKRGQPMYDPSKLVDMGKLVKADSIVLSDYPKEPYYKTVTSAELHIPRFKEAGFKTFFCPQSELGDLEGLMKSFEWAIFNHDIDYIGVSILACPIALGVNETKHTDGSKDEAYRLQRYLSRFTIFQELDRRGLLGYHTEMGRFHCLGMTDGPKEVELLRPYHEHIFSWDSSSAIWHGINGIEYDKSPTGLRNGKFEQEVDFNVSPVSSFDSIASITYNMGFIDKMCRSY
jgi:hypothetical protein